MNYKTKADLMNRVEEHYKWAEMAGYEVVGVFLQGSWNYSPALCDSESDVDTKCWVLPTLEDLALNKKPASFTHEMENGEHCDVKDVRLYMGCFRKQNVNFVEVLFTEYYKLNPKYADLVQVLFDNREKVANYNPTAAVHCMLGMATQKQKALCHPYEGLKEKLAKYGYDGKQLSHALRMEYMLNDYLKGRAYEDLLKMPDTVARYLLSVKRHRNFEGQPPMTKEEAVVKMDEVVERMRKKVDDKTQQLKAHGDADVDKMLNNFVVECLNRFLRG